MKLSDQTILITGASSGIGAHTAELFARHGARVGLVDKNAERMSTIAQTICSAGGEAVAIVRDVTSFDKLNETVDLIERDLGPISTLVNNAGIGHDQAAISMPVSEFERVLNVNLLAPFALSQICALKWIDRQTPGRILNISSLSAFKAVPGLSAYATSKAALAHLTTCLAREWVKHDICVNALAPGYVLTDINAHLWDEAFGKKLISRFPKRRIGEPSELDNALLFFVDPSTSYITGQTLIIDDGQGLG